MFHLLSFHPIKRHILLAWRVAISALPAQTDKLLDSNYDAASIPHFPCSNSRLRTAPQDLPDNQHICLPLSHWLFSFSRLSHPGEDAPAFRAAGGISVGLGPTVSGRVTNMKRRGRDKHQTTESDVSLVMSSANMELPPAAAAYNDAVQSIRETEYPMIQGRTTQRRLAIHECASNVLLMR